MKQNRRFLRLIKEAKGNWAKREDKEFMNFPFSCSLISRGMVKCRCMRKALCARSRQQQTRKDEDHMKKFLSLLLALTLVLSLVVVPARATGDTLQSGITIAGKDDAKIGDIVAFSVPATATVTPGSEASESSQDAITATLKSCVWSVTGGTEVSSSTGASYEVRANAAGTMRVTCTATY